MSAEEQLAKQGVFKGHSGLRGLAEANEFWEQQPYGTRLYYGPGGGQYLHRGVLQAALRLLDGMTLEQMSEALQKGGSAS